MERPKLSWDSQEQALKTKAYNVPDDDDLSMNYGIKIYPEFLHRLYGAANLITNPYGQIKIVGKAQSHKVSYSTHKTD
jgi:hypothetical protein